MSIQVTVAIDHGGPVAVKTATGDDVERLCDEAERLRRAPHPGVVTLVDDAPIGDARRLRTRYAGDPLTRWSGTVAQAAGLCAAVAATVADLHDTGLVHGRIDASHVLVGGDGRPRLCGLSGADDGRRADDVEAIGHLLRTLIGRADGARIRPLSRPRAATGERRLTPVADRACDPVADRRPAARALADAVLAAVPDAELPPPARPARGTGGEADVTLVVDFLRATRTAGGRSPAWDAHVLADRPAPGTPTTGGDRAPGDQCAPGDDGPTSPWPVEPTTTGPVPLPRLGETRGGGDEAARVLPADAHRRARRRRAARAGAAGVAGLTLVAGGLVTTRHPDGDSRAQPPASAPASGQAGRVPTCPDAPGSPTAGRTCPTSPPSGSTRCPTVETVVADVDGDGCPESVRVTGRTVSAAGASWSLGRPGDVVTVGDWDCDGRASAALLRPDTGDVFVFPGWASAGDPVTVDSTDTVADATGLRVDADAGGCDTLVVEQHSGEAAVEAVRS